MSRYTVPSLDVNDKLARLCRRWGTEEVVRLVKDWAAFMELQIATMRPHPLDSDGRVSDASDS